MMNFISNAFLALFGLFSLVEGFREQKNRRTNLLWALFCISIAGIGFVDTDKKLHVGIISGAAIAFWVATKAWQARLDRNRKPEHSKG